MSAHNKIFITNLNINQMNVCTLFIEILLIPAIKVMSAHNNQI